MSKFIQDSYWRVVWRQFVGHRVGVAALVVFAVFVLIGLYAPFLASSKPFIVNCDGHWYFPLFRYLFYSGFYTKPIDIFFNLLMFIIPLWGISIWLLSRLANASWKRVTAFFLVAQVGLFLYLAFGPSRDPASDPALNLARQDATQEMRFGDGLSATTSADPLLSGLSRYPDWNFELKYMTPYAQLNAFLRYQQRKDQHQHFAKYGDIYSKETGRQTLPTLWELDRLHDGEEISREESSIEQTASEYEQAKKELPALIEAYRPFSEAFQKAAQVKEEASLKVRSLEEKQRQMFAWTAQKDSPEIIKAREEYRDAEQAFAAESERSVNFRAPLVHARGIVERHDKAEQKIAYAKQRQEWLESSDGRLAYRLMPFVRHIHWEEDAGGEQSLNKYVDWWELTRINRKDLVAALIFGVRVSLVVGITSVFLALLIGVPVGALSGYYAGKMDIIVCRLMEIWEAMPTFFMLLMIVAVTQSKSVFLVIVILGVFGWTSFARYVRGESLKQRNLPYVDACRSIGFRNRRIIFSHILPNAIPPLLTLLPFAMMGAITSEAGLSFLGLGEEGTSSWGVLMDEGRTAFPGESYLLWPPALVLTVLLVAIALIGDALRDSVDPKLRK